MSSLTCPITSTMDCDADFYNISAFPLIEVELEALKNHWLNCLKSHSKPQFIIKCNFDPRYGIQHKRFNRIINISLDLFVQIYNIFYEYYTDKKKPIIQIYTEDIYLSNNLVEKLREIAAIVSMR